MHNPLDQPPSPHTLLRQLIGQRFRYQSQCWTLIEVLPEADALVLRLDARGLRAVQADLYGVPARRSLQTLTLPISAADGGYSIAVTDLLAGRIADE